MSKFQKPKAQTVSSQDEKNVAAVIERGGRVPSEQPTNADYKNVQLRLMDELLTQIDTTRGERRPKPSRHNWLLEAIYEKLERDSKLA